MTDSSYLQSVLRLFKYYKALGDKAIERVSDQKIHFQYNEN